MRKQVEQEMQVSGSVMKKKESTVIISKMLVKRKLMVRKNKNSMSRSANKVSKMLIMNSMGFAPKWRESTKKKASCAMRKQAEQEMQAPGSVIKKKESTVRISKMLVKRMLMKRKPMMGKNKNLTSKSANKISKMLIMNDMGNVPNS